MKTMFFLFAAGLTFFSSPPSARALQSQSRSIQLLAEGLHTKEALIDQKNQELLNAYRKFFTDGLRARLLNEISNIKLQEVALFNDVYHDIRTHAEAEDFISLFKTFKKHSHLTEPNRNVVEWPASNRNAMNSYNQFGQNFQILSDRVDYLASQHGISLRDPLEQ